VSIAADGQFDFDDLTAEIAQEASGIGPGDVTANIDANKTFESSGNHIGRAAVVKIFAI
jgi:hypothetical protein